MAVKSASPIGRALPSSYFFYEIKNTGGETIVPVSFVLLSHFFIPFLLVSLFYFFR
jgi:hypothetical protein